MNIFGKDVPLKRCCHRKMHVSVTCLKSQMHRFWQYFIVMNIGSDFTRFFCWGRRVIYLVSLFLQKMYMLPLQRPEMKLIFIPGTLLGIMRFTWDRVTLRKSIRKNPLSFLLPMAKLVGFDTLPFQASTTHTMLYNSIFAILILPSGFLFAA